MKFHVHILALDRFLVSIYGNPIKEDDGCNDYVTLWDSSVFLLGLGPDPGEDTDIGCRTPFLLGLTENVVSDLLCHIDAFFFYLSFKSQ